MSTLKDHTGQKIGMLQIIERGPNNIYNSAQWFADCDCGRKMILILSGRIKKGQHHCGCQFGSRYKKMQEGRANGKIKYRKFNADLRLHPIINSFLYQWKKYAHLSVDYWGPLPESRYCEIPQYTPIDRMETVLREIDKRTGGLGNGLIPNPGHI